MKMTVCCVKKQLTQLSQGNDCYFSLVCLHEANFIDKLITINGYINTADLP